MAVEARVLVLGRTGDGKSALCQAYTESLGYQGVSKFGESSRARSHTHDPVGETVRGVETVDTPGLQDAGGVEKDEVNLRKIVDKAKQSGSVNAFVLVVNEEARRFDSGMQDAVKLFVDSFGPEYLGRVGIVFTHAYGKITSEAAAQWVTDVAELIRERTGYPLNHIPFWQLDLHPEALAAMGVPAERIAIREADRANALKELNRWIRSQQPAMSTANAVYGEYLQRKRAREGEERAEEEKKKREHDLSVIRTEVERQTVQVSDVSVPRYATKQVTHSGKGGGNGLMIAGAATSLVSPLAGAALGLLGSSKKKNVTETVTYVCGSTKTVVTQAQKRNKLTYGSGQFHYEDWVNDGLPETKSQAI